jgi:hypothetical protein
MVDVNLAIVGACIVGKSESPKIHSLPVRLCPSSADQMIGTMIHSPGVEDTVFAGAPCAQFFAQYYTANSSLR